MASRSQLNQHLIRWLPDPARTKFTLVLAHYPTTFEQLQSALELAQVPYQIHLGSIRPAEISQFCETQIDHQPSSSVAAIQKHRAAPAPVYLALTGQLLCPSNNVSNPDRRRFSSIEPRRTTDLANFKVGVMVAERHASRADDDRVRNFCRLMEPRCELGYFIALDDPLLAGKVDQAMQQLLEHYGMKPDEPLQSMLLERLVRRIQRNVARS
jgi:hypothetical protein